MAAIVQQLKDSFFCLHEHLKSWTNRSSQDKGTEDEQESQFSPNQENGVLEVKGRGPNPPVAKRPPGGKTNRVACKLLSLGDCDGFVLPFSAFLSLDSCFV